MSAWPAFQPSLETNAALPGEPSPLGDAGNAADTPPPKRRAKAKAGKGSRLQLHNGPQIRREMARIYKEMKAGEIDVIKGGKLVYVLTELSRALERENVELLSKRLDEAGGK